MGRARAERGAAAFERWYADLYGERWKGLRDALGDDGRYAELRNGLRRTYLLDPASVLAAAALEVQPGERVLDLCAAPGGKSLVLACALFGGGESRRAAPGPGELVCNERSSARRARLHRVLDEHLPPGTRRLVRVTGHDAAKWALYEPAAYDRVLADVPCSSEQHVLLSPGALAEWSPSRPKRLAQGAYAIACAAVDAVRRGGRVVYATCALSPFENDEVVRRIIERGNGDLQGIDADRLAARAFNGYRELVPGEHASGPAPGESTVYGRLILPDRDHGLGPIYFAAIERSV